MGTAPRREPSPLGPTDATRSLARHLLRLLDHAGVTPHQLAVQQNLPYPLAMVDHFLSGEVLPPPYLIDLIATRCGVDRQGLFQAYEFALRSTLSADGFPAPQDAQPVPRHIRPVPRGAQPAPQGAQFAVPGVRFATPSAQPTTPAPAAPPKVRTFATAEVQVVAAPRPSAPDRRTRVRRRTGRRLIFSALGVSAAGAVVVTTAVVGLGQQRSATDNREQPHDVAQAVPPAAPLSAPVPPQPSPQLSTQEQKPAPEGIELLKIGSFTTWVEGWWDAEKVQLKVERNRLRVEVAPDDNSSPMDTMIMQNFAKIRLGKKYVMTFKGSAEVETKVRLSVQRQMTPDSPVWLSKEIKLDAKRRTFSYTFSGEADSTSPVLCFWVGGDPDGQAILLDDVSLIERS